MLATYIYAPDCLTTWVYGVSSTGTFTKHTDMTALPTGASGIPSGWTIVDNEEMQYLTFEAIEDGTFSFTQNTIQYSVDGTTWNDLTVGASTPMVNAGNKIHFKATNPSGTEDNGIGTFSSTGEFNISGNIMSMLYGDDFRGKTDLTGKDYAFRYLFKNCTKLVDASELILPATTLATYCYTSMFFGCTSLTTVPALPATTLANNCYQSMFSNCTSLTTAPALPATTLASSCYQAMFYSCTNLTTAPILPATTLATYCYTYMFYSCTSLIKAPALPATTLANNCYTGMFYGCASLTTAPILPATTLATYCYQSMFRDCTSLIKAPALPATTLASSCYSYMFQDCSNLNNIAMLATNISASNCLYNWVYGVASTGTFTKHPEMTSLLTGYSGIPSGWTVVDCPVGSGD
jgi:hypothetical protein